MSDKRLYRSSTNYMLTGVCGGIAEYFNISKFTLYSDLNTIKEES